MKTGIHQGNNTNSTFNLFFGLFWLSTLFQSLDCTIFMRKRLPATQYYSQRIRAVTML